MNQDIATKVFESLASGVRLDAYRLLVKAGLDGMVAGQLASELAIAPNNLSFHLKALTHAGLVTAEQEGRFQRYRANLPLMQELIAYLTEQCCEGHPEQCASLRADAGCAPALLPPLSGCTAAGCCAETTQVAGCNFAGEYRALGADVTDKREKMNKPYHELILGRIYFGGAADIQQMVDEEGVEVVVDLREEATACAATAEGVRWVQIPLADHAEAPEPALFASAIAAVTEAYQQGRKVAFHCGAGRGRTGTVAAGVLLALGLARDVDSAIAQAKAIRPQLNVKPLQRESLERLYPARPGV